jgi:ABC-2 type transport system permease protein
MSGRIGRRRVLTVARREFLATVTRPGFIATLILMPVLMGLIGVLPAVGLALSGGPEKLLGLKGGGRVNVIGLVDEADAIDAAAVAWHNSDQEAAHAEKRRPDVESELPEFIRSRTDTDRDYGGFDGNWRLQLEPMPDRVVGRDAVASGRAAAVFVIEKHWLQTSAVTVLVPEQSPLGQGVQPGRLAVSRLMRSSLARPWVPDELVHDRLLQIMDAATEEVFPPGAVPEPEPESPWEEGLAFIVPLLFASFFSMSIFIASGYLLDGIGEEKESRVLEVLLASLTPEELLAGKILGLGGAGLLQSFVIVLIGLVPMLALGLMAMGWGTVLAMLGCAGLGYAEYASIMAASGAVAGNRHEGRQISAGFSLLAASPMFLFPVFMTNPDGTAAVVMSLLPPTAPIGMILRLGLGAPPGWHLALAFVGMAISAWLSWRIGSRVFRVAILLTGARPRLGQIWQWVRGR